MDIAVPNCVRIGRELQAKCPLHPCAKYALKLQTWLLVRLDVGCEWTKRVPERGLGAPLTVFGLLNSIAYTVGNSCLVTESLYNINQQNAPFLN
jgi:hypothetical protein